ncbi:hypothetical protein [Tersicoccus sp. Bi-70]|uniref:hypothetical protein n=1 Tax=Tersicoccus sp. Bi-70 TaxID=1897634 RepID=UPI0009780E87|nr:hypothetical protein [Tersicoccus sp. Bi-70]OMH36859.1 hypothetical protein BGP79_14000 [Tersicoccus sp. Bi-70]
MTPRRSRQPWIYLVLGAVLIVNWGIQLALEPGKPSGWIGMAAGVLMVVAAVRGLLRDRRQREQP